MNEAKFDIGLKALINRGKTRIGKTDLKHADGRKMAGLAFDLLDKEFTPYENAVARVQAEGEEAARAAEEVALAEVDTEKVYGQLYATCQARYYEIVADPDEDATLFKRRMGRALIHSPSKFEHLGVDRTSAAMATALEFAEGVLPADHPVLKRAGEVHATLVDKLAKADAEEGERVAAMQSLYDARAHAKRAYLAARKLVDAALMLEETEESISQLMPALASIYHTEPNPQADPTEPAEPVEPVEA